MERENTKGEKTTWRLLYIADPDYRVKPPFLFNGMKILKQEKKS